MRTRRILFGLIGLSFALVALLALTITPAVADRPQPPPGCNDVCRPFVVAHGMKCYFVGCDVQGICRYLC